ncbi:MAG: biotin/lipoyl-containing protein [Paludibacter sp.]|jgi:biotin carboxyl carrier protein|nr:biotin/lipoyl-containing protein [Paludibacter sp.]
MKKFSFTINGDDFAVRVKKVEGDTAELEVNGTPYKVKMHQEIKTTKTPVVLVRKDVQTKQGDERAKENLSPVSESKRPSAKAIKSPLPGSILKVNVAVGDTFKEGDVLMVMESMKMENNILAERNGKILKVCAPAGKAVLQDEVLFEIE